MCNYPRFTHLSHEALSASEHADVGDAAEHSHDQEIRVVSDQAVRLPAAAAARSCRGFFAVATTTAAVATTAAFTTAAAAAAAAAAVVELVHVL